MAGKRKRKIFSPIYLTLVLLVLYLPILMVVIYSFNSGRTIGAWQGFTTSWYTRLMSNALMGDALRNSLLLAALSCLGALTLWRRAPAMTLSLIAGAAGAGLAALISHKYYVHYLVLGAPCAVTGVALLLAAAKRRGKRLCGAGYALCVALCAAILAVSGAQANESRLAWRGEDFDAFTADAQALYAQVPEQERESFMAYRVEPRWYVAAKALPCMRFYFLQEILAQADPAVMEEIVEEFESDPPRWLVIYYNREFGPPYDARVAAIFESDYEFVDARGQYQLLRLKGAGT